MLGTIQRGLAVHVCARMTQHKSIHVIPPKQWLKKLSGEKGSGALSATAIFENFVWQYCGSGLGTLKLRIFPGRHSKKP